MTHADLRHRCLAGTLLAHALGGMTLLAACSTSPTEKNTDRPSLPAGRVSPAVVSAPTPGSDHNRGGLAYVSMRPGTDSTGVTALISNGQVSEPAPVTMIAGGFDPVGIKAAPGETLQIRILSASGSDTRGYAVVPAHSLLNVVRTSPPQRKTEVPLYSVVQVIFSEPIDSTSLAGAIHLRHERVVPGTVEAVVSGGTVLGALFRPNQPLAPATEYEVEILNRVTSLAGGALSAPATATFTTSQGDSKAQITLDFSACNVDDQPMWFASQDGSRPWNQVIEDHARYRFDIATARGAFAFVTRNSSPQAGTIRIEFYGRQELQTVDAGRYCPSHSETILATVRNLPGRHFAVVAFGDATGYATSDGLVPVHQLPGAPGRLGDLLGYASRRPDNGASDYMPSRSDRLFLARDVAEVAPGGTLAPEVDFAGPSSAAPAAAVMAVSNVLDHDELSQGMAYETGPRCEQHPLYGASDNDQGGTSRSFKAFGVPDNLQRPMDRHRFTVRARQQQIGGSSDLARTVSDEFQLMRSRSLALPSPMPVFAPDYLAGSHIRLRFRYLQPADLGTSVRAVIGHGDSRLLVMTASLAGYFAGNGIDLAIPDFSGVPGWDNSWLQRGPPGGNTWSVEGARGTGLPAVSGPCETGQWAASSRTGPF